MPYTLKLLLILTVIAISRCDYQQQREELLRKEEAQTTGGKIILNEKEQKVNKILMGYKQKELNLTHPEHFLLSKHFFDIRGDIVDSKVFQFIKLLPKGANLHTHINSMLSIEKFINLIYTDVFICVLGDTFSLTFWNNTYNDCDVLDKAKNMNIDYKTAFKGYLSLFYNPYYDKNDIQKIFLQFLTAIDGLETLLENRRFFKDYLYEGLLELYNDNVMYVEIRAMASDKEIGHLQDFATIKLCKEVIDNFVATHPDFLGGKLIFSVEYTPNYTISDVVNLNRKLKKAFPGFIAGIDLFYRSLFNHSTVDHHFGEFWTLRNKSGFFCHAGETILYGIPEDLALVDAILLGSKRIAHGYSLYKHPDAAKLAKHKNIAFEVSPISTQAFGYIKDIRNHPAAYMIANDIPIVVTNDFPIAFGTKGLSYDWYVAFMGIAHVNADLRFLKQLAVNSIVYSRLDNKTYSLQLWQEKWDLFLDIVLDGYV